MAGDLELLNAIIDSCKELHGTERCKVIKDQGDYQWIVQLKFTEEIAAQFSILRDHSQLMDIYLKGQKVTDTQRVSFNRAVVPYRCNSDIAQCLEAAEQWWTKEAEEISEKASGFKKTLKDKKKKKATKPTEPEETSIKGMKPAQDVISRIVWDDSLPSENFVVGYIDRFLGIIEKPFTAFNWEHFSAVDPEATAIPRHRIQYFKYGSSMVWDRRNRRDLIFGTGLVQNEKTLDALIKEENQKLGFVFEEPNEFSDCGTDSEEDLNSEAIHINAEASTLPVSDFPDVTDVPAGVRPNFYLSIPIRSEALLTQIRTAQEALRQQFPRAVRKRMDATNLHITLCLFVTDGTENKLSPEFIADAISSAEKELKVVLKETKIHVKGLSMFRGSRVIFAKPEKLCLKRLLDELVTVFMKHQIKFYVPENIHLTIYRLHPLRREEEWRDLENAVAVSKLSAAETSPTLSLKPMGELKIQAIRSMGQVTEYLPGFARLKTDLQMENWEILQQREEKRLAINEEENVEILKEVARKKSVGFHVRNAWDYDSIVDVVYKASSVGGTAMSFFFQYPRDFNGKSIQLPEDPEVFKKACEKSGVSLENIVPHGSYWLNPGSTDEVYLEKTRNRIVKDVRTCETLGIPFYNFHPGVLTGDRSVEKCIENIIGTVDYVHENTEGCDVILLLETAAGQGNEIGGKFEEIRTIIDGCKNQDRVAVCVDTCHIFAAGYDIRTAETYESTIQEFNRVIGLNKLRAFHLNDSKVSFNARQDRHEIIGKGHIGIEAFRLIMKDPRFHGIPMILETPKQPDDHLSELQMLRIFEDEDLVQSSFEGIFESPDQCESNRILKTMQKKPNALEQLCEQIAAFYDKNCLDMEAFREKDEIRKQLEAVLKQEFGASVFLAPIGGLINGLGSKSSDIDLSLILPPEFYGINNSWQSSVDILRRAIPFVKVLKAGDFVKSCELRTGVIPILRVELYSVEVDINCNDLPSVYASHLLRYYSKYDWRFPAISLVIKKWAGSLGINDAKVGYLNNYTLVLMVLHYLQAGVQKPVLPNLQNLFPEFFSGMTNPKNLKYNEEGIFNDGRLKSENEDSVAEILVGFFAYFSNFRFDEKWISIKKGKAKLRDNLIPGVKRFLIYIEDPFEEKSTARCVLESDNLKRIVQSFRDACTRLMENPSMESLGIPI